MEKFRFVRKLFVLIISAVLFLMGTFGAKAEQNDSVAARPVKKDFEWLWENEMIIPEGAVTLSGEALSGEWKAMIFGILEEDVYGYYNFFDADLNIDGNSSSMKADWYMSYISDITTGKQYNLKDETKVDDMNYKGSFVKIDNMLVVWDDTLNYTFISGRKVHAFIINSWYQLGNVQYAVGSVLDANAELVGIVALTRGAIATASEIPRETGSYTVSSVLNEPATKSTISTFDTHIMI